MKKKTKNFLNKLALVLLIAGAVNWGLVGAFGFNLVSSVFGASFSNWVYVLVGLSGIYKVFNFK